MLRTRYEIKPPTALPIELVSAIHGHARTLDDGQTGVSDDLAARIRQHEIWATDPSEEWRFTIHAEYWRGVLCDRLAVQCMDLRTMPDWEMLIRLRSWVLDDRREAFIWLPDQDVRDRRWQTRYENERFNNLAMISPRAVQPGGVALPGATQSPSAPRRRLTKGDADYDASVERFKRLDLD